MEKREQNQLVNRFSTYIHELKAVVTPEDGRLVDDGAVVVDDASRVVADAPRGASMTAALRYRAGFRPPPDTTLLPRSLATTINVRATGGCVIAKHHSLWDTQAASKRRPPHKMTAPLIRAGSRLGT